MSLNNKFDRMVEYIDSNSNKIIIGMDIVSIFFYYIFVYH